MNSHNNSSGASGLVFTMMLLSNLIFGGMSINYLLDAFVHQTLGWFPAAILGLFLGQIAVPVAIIFWCIRPLLGI